jgi:hypothetical protein
MMQEIALSLDQPVRKVMVIRGTIKGSRSMGQVLYHGHGIKCTVHKDTHLMWDISIGARVINSCVYRTRL